MALKVVRGEDIQVSSILMTIYAKPSAGKTSLAFTADRPLLLDFDRGAHRSSSRTGHIVATVQSWDDVARLDASDVADFDCIIVDTAGAALDCLAAFLMRNNAKLASGPSLTLQGWGALKGTFQNWLTGLRSYGKDVILICHADEQNRDGAVVERIAVSGGSKAEIYNSSDLVGRLGFDGATRVLSFEQSEYMYAKNVGLPPIEIPDASSGEKVLAKVIEDAKTAINIQTEEQRLERDRLSLLRGVFMELEPYSRVFNESLDTLKMDGAPITDGQLLIEIGRMKGIDFDRDAKIFVGGEDEPIEDESVDIPEDVSDAVPTLI